jgi:imidazolonepropionase-like amidohydrolase
LPDGASFRFQLLELVRHGLRDDEVLRAVTLTPAEILGIQDRCGSLEVGKDADILFFSGDPLTPTSDLLEVVVGGESVYTREEVTR